MFWLSTKYFIVSANDLTVESRNYNNFATTKWLQTTPKRKIHYKEIKLNENVYEMRKMFCIGVQKHKQKMFKTLPLFNS